MRVLVLGAYGFIGLATARSLHAAGHEVTGLGRSATTGPKLFPAIRWMSTDIARLATPADWQPLLADIDVVVNAAGALQDGARDDLERIHHTAIAALVAACEARGGIRLVQISAPGANEVAATAFMRSKARGDAAVKRSTLRWVVLRPGLVLGPNAYGGSALLRMLAALPLVNVLAMPDKRIQTVALDDVTQVVRDAVEGRLPDHTDLDLVEANAHRLEEVVDQLRRWLGLPAPWATIVVPNWCLRVVTGIADALGLPGWRSPLRATAMRSIDNEVIGDAAPLRLLRGADLKSLAQTLDVMPATIQERWFARLYLLMPLMVATLCVFWLASGAIALLDVARAAAVLPQESVPRNLANTLVIGGALVDIALGLAILVRPLARRACLGMVATSFAYLLAGTLLTPGLWLDPLGPLVKVLPATLLALIAMAVMEER